MPKKRSPGDGGLYYLKSRGLWRGVIDVGFKPDGSRKQKYVTARTQTEARAKLAKVKAEIVQYGAPLDNAVTVESWANHWLETVCRPTLKPQPLKTYQSIVRTWIIPTLGKKRMAKLTPSDLRLISQAIVGAGRSSSTALKAHNIMSAMLESARLDGIVGRNLSRDVVAPKAAVTGRDALSEEETMRILGAATRQPDGTRWWFAILAGMRQGERAGATLDSIDFERGTFTVQWSLTEAQFEHGCGGTCGKARGGSCPQRRLVTATGLEYRQLDGRLCLVRPKSGRPRTFPMPRGLALELRAYLAGADHLPNPHGLVWRNDDGSPITATQDNDAWRVLLLDAGVITAEQAKPRKDRAAGTPATPTTHWARHTTATMLMRLGAKTKTAGAIMGHASEQITERVYQHASDLDGVAAMDSMWENFSKALEP